MKKILFNEIGPNGTEYKKDQWPEFVIHNEKEVKGFFGPYRYLSNFEPVKITLDGVEYSSVEIAFQAAKWKLEDRDFFKTCTSRESIKFNRENNPNLYGAGPWDKVKVSIMRDLLKQKFDRNINPEFATKLKETGDKHLEEMNWWGDLFWGTDNLGNGENNLGKLLMEIRATV